MRRLSFKLFQRYLKASFEYSYWYCFNSPFKIMCRDSRFNSQHLGELQEKLRRLLCLYPGWGRGHLLLAVLSYFQFQNSRSGESKGVLRVSLDLCRSDPSLQAQSVLLDVLYHFIDKKFETVTARYESPNWDAISRKLKAHEAYLALETVGAAYLYLGSRAKARECFLKIPVQYHNSEIKGALAICS